MADESATGDAAQSAVAGSASGDGAAAAAGAPYIDLTSPKAIVKLVRTRLRGPCACSHFFGSDER